MGKRKSKSYDRHLFILFANCKFESKSLYSLFKGALKSFFYECDENSKEPLDEMIGEIYSLLDFESFRFCEPVEKYFLEVIEPIYKIHIYGDHDRNKEMEDIKRNYLKEQFRKHNKENEIEIWDYFELDETLRYMQVRPHYIRGYEFISGIALSQYKLRDILTKVIEGTRLEGNLFVDLNGFHHNMTTKLSFGQDTYFKVENVSTTHILPGEPDGIDILGLFNNMVFFQLVKFLCSKDSKKLRRCKECGKFFIAKYNRGDIKRCSNKCKQAYWNREYKKKGKHAEYMRKKRLEKPEWII